MSRKPKFRCQRPAWKRPAKFAFVGAIGIVVQLLSLHWLVNLGCRYLLATAIGVEAALLHNFVWHEKFTWIDRNQFTSAGLGSRFIRFHLSNGLISIGGNVFWMQMFVGQLGIPVIPANLLSITICSVTNFWASDRWVFVPAAPAETENTKLRQSRDLRLEATFVARKEHR
jgi:putative flippase GtrA